MKSNPEVTEIFRVLSSPQDTVYEEQCHALERFVDVMYSRMCPHQTVKFYLHKVTKALRIFLRLKPLLHSISKEEPMQKLPSPAEWGWQQSPEGWSPKWTTLANASKACSELIICGCKRACRGLCKCKPPLHCTVFLCRKLLPRIE